MTEQGYCLQGVVISMLQASCPSLTDQQACDAMYAMSQCFLQHLCQATCRLAKCSVCMASRLNSVKPPYEGKSRSWVNAELLYQSGSKVCRLIRH